MGMIDACGGQDELKWAAFTFIKVSCYIVMKVNFMDSKYIKLSEFKKMTFCLGCLTLKIFSIIIPRIENVFLWCIKICAVLAIL